MRILRNLLIVVVILWGLLALLVRSATPFIADYRGELGDVLSRQLGVPVTVGRLDARWHGIAPLLELQQISIGSGEDTIAIERASLDLNLRELLSGPPLDAIRLSFEGMSLTLVREPSGQLHLEGIGRIGLDGEAAPGTPLLPSEIRLFDTRVVWIDRKAGKPPFTIDDIDIFLDRDGSRLDLRARLETTSGNADLSARLNGFLHTQEWSGDTYLKVDNLDVADLLAHYLPANYGLHGLQFDLESWGRWHDAAPVEAQGGFQLRDLRLRPKTPDTVPLNLVRAGADFTMSRAGGDLRIGLKDLLLAFRGHQWPFANAAISVSDGPGDTRRIMAAADYLRIDDVLRILQVRLPVEEFRQPIRQLQPRGEIRNLRLLVERSAERSDWRVQGDLSGITTDPWDDIPGVENISGRLHGQQDHLVVELDSRDASVRFRELFRDPLQLHRLDGRVDLLRDGDAWRVSSEHLIADTPDIDTRTRLLLEHRPGSPLFLDLQTDFSDGDASHALRYYPVSIMDEDVVDWLDSSIRSGRVPGGSALVYGSLDDFPFEDPYSGVFQVVFDTQDLELDYYEGWPKLHSLDAHVRFHGNQLDIELDRAQIYDSEVVDATARIPSLNPSAPLEVQGTVKGALGNVLKVLGEEALREDFGEFVDPLRASGDATLQLAFKIPLEDEIGYALDGRLNMAGARLTLPEWDFRMDDIHGHLDFNLDGLSATGIKASTLGSPILVDVATREDGATRVRARGGLKLKNIAAQLPDIPLQAASGSSEFLIDVDVPPAGAPDTTPGQISVYSDLQGVRIDLPPPFGKSGREKRTLQIRLPISVQPAPGRLSYAGQLDARFTNDFKRVDVTLGGASAKPGTKPGIRIGGKLGTIDLIDWHEALSHLQTGADTTPESLHLDLLIDRVQADNLAVDDLQLQASLSDRFWQGKIEAPNLSGSFRVPQDPTKQAIQVDLLRLHLDLPLGEEKFHPTPVPDAREGPDPSTLPSLVVNIADLRVNAADLGRLRVNALRAPDGLQLTAFNLQGGQLELESAGHWSRIGSRFETEWGGRISSANLGELLVDLGYSPQVEQAASSIGFLLRWPGNPAQFHSGTLEGSVELAVENGRIVELDPGVTRVVGLLNLGALTRRLRLDFSDIYKKGYSFDSMRGDFLFADGKASTENFRVDGPTGRIDLDGSADLINRTLDQHVTVTPRIDATLPIAGTLAGGPVAGIAVLVVQKAMTKQVDNINRFEYSLSGPWQEPEVHQLDSGGTLSKLLQPLTGKQQAGGEQNDDAASATEPEAAMATVDAQAPAPVTPEEPSTTASQSTNPLSGLLRILNESRAHGADLPGTSE